MIAKLQKWGNSQGIRIPKQLLMLAAFKEDDEVEIIAEYDKIIIRHPEKTIKKYKIEELFAEYDVERKCKTKEDDWGSPSGKEEW
jgi:antitoxin MazE